MAVSSPDPTNIRDQGYGFETSHWRLSGSPVALRCAAICNLATRSRRVTLSHVARRMQEHELGLRKGRLLRRR